MWWLSAGRQACFYGKYLSPVPSPRWRTSSPAKVVQANFWSRTTYTKLYIHNLRYTKQLRIFTGLRRIITAWVSWLHSPCWLSFRLRTCTSPASRTTNAPRSRWTATGCSSSGWSFAMHRRSIKQTFWFPSHDLAYRIFRCWCWSR